MNTAPLLRMTSEEFQEFHALTARPLKAYLQRLLNNSALADELLQESYYKFLRADTAGFTPNEQKNYVFRIGVNLVNDLYRGKAETSLPLKDVISTAEAPRQTEFGLQQDVGKALNTLKARERELVWLAYVEGSTHREIAEILGLREVSIRPMLFRVREKLAGLLKSMGYCEKTVS